VRHEGFSCIFVERNPPVWVAIVAKLLHLEKDKADRKATENRDPIKEKREMYWLAGTDAEEDGNGMSRGIFSGIEIIPSSAFAHFKCSFSGPVFSLSAAMVQSWLPAEV
jgi:hypothetical protein